MSERSTATTSAEASETAPHDNDGTPTVTAPAGDEATSSSADGPDTEMPGVDSPSAGGTDSDADATGAGETVPGIASAAEGRTEPESPGAPEMDPVMVRVSRAAADAAAAAANAARAAADAATAAAKAAEAAAAAADLAATAISGCAATTGATEQTGTDSDLPTEASTDVDVPEDEAEPTARGIAAWTADRRRDLLVYIGVPLVTLFAAPALVLFWGIVILGSNTDSPALCEGVSSVNGCEELTWVVIRVHVLGFLGLWALLWAVPWRRGLRTPRVLLALAASAFLFAGMLRLAA